MHLSRRVSSVSQCVWSRQTAVVSINHAHELSLPMCAIDLAGAACCGFYWSINFWLWWRLMLLTVFQAFQKSVLLLFFFNSVGFLPWQGIPQSSWKHFSASFDAFSPCEPFSPPSCKINGDYYFYNIHSKYGRGGAGCWSAARCSMSNLNEFWFRGGYVITTSESKG